MTTTWSDDDTLVIDLTDEPDAATDDFAEEVDTETFLDPSSDGVPQPVARELTAPYYFPEVRVRITTTSWGQ